MPPIARKLLCVAAVLATGAAVGQAVPAGTVADIKERTRPFGQLCLKGQPCASATADASATAAPAAQSGSDVYNKFCHTCHNTGLNDAPKLGDAAAWEARLAKGRETLYANSIGGLNLMPPKGGRPDLSDEAVRLAVDYMLEQL